MASVNLDASLRTSTGKGAARKLRAAGRLPAVVYSAGQPARSISINPTELELALQRTQNRNTLIHLKVEGDGVASCLIREAQRHPVSRALEHVDFYQVGDDQLCSVNVKVVPVGTAIGTKLGGKLQLVRREMQVECKPADIPEAIKVDVTNLEVNAYIRASAVVPPPGCKLVFSGDFNVVTVVGKRTAQGGAEKG